MRRIISLILLALALSLGACGGGYLDVGVSIPLDPYYDGCGYYDPCYDDPYYYKSGPAEYDNVW